MFVNFLTGEFNVFTAKILETVSLLQNTAPLHANHMWIYFNETGICRWMGFCKLLLSLITLPVQGSRRAYQYTRFSVLFDWEVRLIKHTANQLPACRWLVCYIRWFLKYYSSDTSIINQVKGRKFNELVGQIAKNSSVYFDRQISVNAWMSGQKMKPLIMVMLFCGKYT